jgi:hypothetical protein
MKHSPFSVEEPMLGMEPFFPAFADELEINLVAASPSLAIKLWHVQVKKTISTELAL